MDFLNALSVITVFRIDRYLNESFKKSVFDDFIEKFSLIDVNEMSDYVNDDAETMSEQKRRYLNIINLFSAEFTNIVRNILDFNIMISIFPEIKKRMNDIGIKIDLKLSFGIENIEYADFPKISAILKQLSGIFIFDFDDGGFTDNEIIADNSLIRYISGDDTPHSLIKDISENFCHNTDLHKAIINHNLVNDAVNILKSEKSILQISGKELSGKKFILKHSAKILNKEILFVDFKLLIKYSNSDLLRSFRLLIREALIHKRILCWYNISRETLEIKNWSIKEFIIMCIKQPTEYNIQTCICSDNSVNLLYESDLPVNIIDIPEINENERIYIWKDFCDIYNINDIDYFNFAIRYKLSVGKISEIFKRTQAAENTQSPKADFFEKACLSVGETSGKNLKRKKSDYTLQDLKLPANQKNIIKQICDNFNNFSKVYYEWHMKEKFAYGRNISGLFSGPPGTGKTMTAHVIANTLKIPLMQVDMSQIFDKYVGETEKNIDEIFNEAEKLNCVLFLDEADSLCGKRSESSSSNDKFANNNTAFLLQRIENYDGIVLLATNFINNIDNAFMRRMKYVIEFDMPSKDIRKELWISSFTEYVPISDDLDFDYLAENFEFSGANIKNVVLSSVFLSAQSNIPVNMKYILKSILNEYFKMKKNVMSGEFGQYEKLYFEILNEDKN